MSFRDSCRSWWNRKFFRRRRNYFLVLLALRRASQELTCGQVAACAGVPFSAVNSSLIALWCDGLVAYDFNTERHVVPRSKRKEVDKILRENRRKWL